MEITMKDDNGVDDVAPIDKNGILRDNVKYVWGRYFMKEGFWYCMPAKIGT